MSRMVSSGVADPAARGMGSAGPSVSVVVPVHNEAAILRRTLTTLLAGTRPGELEVVVVCNGCTDQSAEVARSIGSPVRVIEIPNASKVDALNAGDAAAATLPRVYLDADVEVTIESVRRIVDVLRSGQTLIAAPALTVDLSDSGWAVRAYYTVWLRLPWVHEDVVGSGFYALSAAGRQRFGRFPDVLGDDLWVSALFERHERQSVRDVTFTVRPPGTVRQLLRRRARIILGIDEVRAALPSGRAVYRRQGAALDLLRRQPRLAPQVAVYLSLSVVAEIGARRRRRRGDRRWDGQERFPLSATTREGDA
jgi:glycosyltransferase involved in cell wall biosynthesis